MSQIRERTIIEKKIILGFLRRLTWPGLSESSPWPIFRKFVHLSKFKFHWDKKSKILWRFHGVVVGVVGGGGDDDVASQLFSDILHVVVDITTKAKKLHWSLFLQKKFPLEMEKIIFFSIFFVVWNSLSVRGPSFNFSSSFFVSEKMSLSWSDQSCSRWYKNSRSNYYDSCQIIFLAFLPILLSRASVENVVQIVGIVRVVIVKFDRLVG